MLLELLCFSGYCILAREYIVYNWMARHPTLIWFSWFFFSLPLIRVYSRANYSFLFFLILINTCSIPTHIQGIYRIPNICDQWLSVFFFASSMSLCSCRNYRTWIHSVFSCVIHHQRYVKCHLNDLHSHMFHIHSFNQITVWSCHFVSKLVAWNRRRRKTN